MVDGHGADEVDDGGRGQSVADERDQAGDERDHAALRRDVAGRQRDAAGDRRDVDGGERDVVGDRRDAHGDQRDLAADLRDRAAEQHEGSIGAGTGVDVSRRSAEARREAASDRLLALQDRRAGAGERSRAELDRTTALADRGAGAIERVSAGRDRSTASADRDASAHDRATAALDGLTGVYLRGAGLVELAREMARSSRTAVPLTLAYVDIDHLKAVNDSRGHAAGDQMILEVAETLRTMLRPYDLIMRFGGDEFVCVISGLNPAGAATRLNHVNEVLASRKRRGSVTIGLAEFRPGDTPEELLARGDAALYAARHDQRHHAD